MTVKPSPRRVRTGHVAWLSERLSERDRKILGAVEAFRLMTGWQLDRLLFNDLAGRSRTVTRSRVLARLVAWRVLTRLPRRIGGAKRGSSVAVYRLDSAGQQLLALRANTNGEPRRVRSTDVPGERFVAHTLAVAELHLDLVDADRDGRLTLREFLPEPQAWWPNGLGGWLKPDAYFVVSNGRTDHLWWSECDRATESGEAIKRKLLAYLDFYRRGHLGPRDAMPRVLVTVPHEQRRDVVARVIRQLSSPADELFVVAVDTNAVSTLLNYLME